MLTSSHLSRLQRTLRFSDDDLQANRAGKLGHHQLELLEDAYRQARLLEFVAVFLFGCILISPGVLCLQADRQSGTRTDYLVVLFVALVVFVAMAAVHAVRWPTDGVRKLRQDIESAHVQSISGRVKVDASPNYTTACFTLSVWSEVFSLPVPSGDNGFIDGKRYRLYFTPQTHKLMAAEPLPALTG